MLFDTHLHIIYKDRLNYPWLKDVPALDRDWHYEEYESVANRLGIIGALHMEVDVAPSDINAESALVCDLMQRPQALIKGAISSARPEATGFDAFLDTLDLSVVKGIRRVLHVVPDEMSQSDLFRENINKLGSKNLPFDICMRVEQLPLAAALVDACPNTKFVLDHCGNPDIAGDRLDSWRRQIVEISKRETLYVKISGITANAAPDWTLDTMRPYFETLVENFGWDRVVWGSDSPVCTLNSNLEQWVGTTYALLNEVSSTERRKFGFQNAKSLWQLP